jgi:hypothetical protein
LKTGVKFGKVTDFDHDGLSDLVLRFENDRVEVMPGNGSGFFKEGYQFAARLAIFRNSFPDLNGDGKPDLLYFSKERIKLGPTIEMRLNLK